MGSGFILKAASFLRGSQLSRNDMFLGRELSMGFQFTDKKIIEARKKYDDLITRVQTAMGNGDLLTASDLMVKAVNALGQLINLERKAVGLEPFKIDKMLTNATSHRITE